MVEVRATTDETLQADIDTMLDLEDWTTPNDPEGAEKESFTVRGATGEWERNDSFERNSTLVLSEYIPEPPTANATVLPVFSHRVHILVRNQMVGHHLSFVCDRESRP